jgi:hypothetical protein
MNTSSVWRGFIGIDREGASPVKVTNDSGNMSGRLQWGPLNRSAVWTLTRWLL